MCVNKAEFLLNILFKNQGTQDCIIYQMKIQVKESVEFQMLEMRAEIRELKKYEIILENPLKKEIIIKRD